jgi:3-oxoacyl-[acyl-carrier protein] reductase
MIILITGTSRGIGKYLAQSLLDNNHIVIGTSRQKCEIQNPNYKHFTASVDDEQEAVKILSSIRKEFGRLDVLINNAGIASMNHSFLTPISTAKNMLNTNVIGTFLYSRESAKLMRKNNWGRIINFVTFAVPFKLEGEAVYAASKAAVISLTEILAREYAEYGITINAVAPPAVKTDLIKGVPEEKLQKLINRQAIHKYGTPVDIMNLIEFLISDKSDMITGETIFMGGV